LAPDGEEAGKSGETDARDLKSFSRKSISDGGWLGTFFVALFVALTTRGIPRLDRETLEKQ
jgi:hypothetical protein